MSKLRGMTTLLVLGTLLLPPHWCCVFPLADVMRLFGMSATEVATAGAAEANQLRCCAGRTPATLTLATPEPAAKAGERRPCCRLSSALRMRTPGGVSAAGESARSGEVLAESLPLERALCPYCNARILTTAKASAHDAGKPMLPAVGSKLPEFGAAPIAVIAHPVFNVPISGDLLARHCRWNC